MFSPLSYLASKVEASIVDHVHLTTHQGHVMSTRMRTIFFKQKKLRFMWWQLVIDDPHKRFDNCWSQTLALMGKAIDQLCVTLILPLQKF